jgi:anthranilate phosphoribosyltransferase
VPLVAGALAALGAERAWVVHSDDGLDELSVCAPTRGLEVRDGAISGEILVEPTRLGVERTRRDELAGGDAAEGARRLTAILDGTERSAASEAVALNAAAALVVAEVVADLPEGLARSRECVARGAGAALLERVVRRARELAP